MEEPALNFAPVLDTEGGGFASLGVTLSQVDDCILAIEP